MSGRLSGEVAIVTGSTGGLGRVIAELFVAEGASVVTTGRAERKPLAGASFIPADITSSGDRERLVAETVDSFGKLTVLVNNAVSPDAIAKDGSLTTIDEALWHDMLNIALVAAAEMCRLSIPPMIAAGDGSIVNVSAKSATLARPGQTAYSAAKAGMNALSRSIAADYSRQGVRCNTLQPGYIIHETRDQPMPAARRAELEAMQLTRLATARDVALSALFLASNESAVITGIVLPVDGGSTSVRGRVL